MTKHLNGQLVLCAVAGAMAQPGTSLIWKPVDPFQSGRLAGTPFASSFWRLSRDGRAHRVYLGLRLGRTPVATRASAPATACA